MPDRPICVESTACSECGGIGQDDQAHFWCSPCKGEGTIPARLRHYEVFSPEITTGGYYEPPDTFRCWGVYLAANARAAKVLAVRDDEFKPWLRDSAGSPPFKGLTAKPFVCEHGWCCSCRYDEDGNPECPDCLDEDAEPARLELADANG